MTRPERATAELLDAARAAEPERLLRSIAVSMASFIAEIDGSSHTVADYIEQRLAPLARFVNADERVRLALAEIAADARKLQVEVLDDAEPKGGDDAAE